MLSWIPSYQTLGPWSGWRRNSERTLPYPLNHRRSRYYYLGRNAVYHGTAALGLTAGDEILFPSYYSGTESAPLRHLGLKLNYYSVDERMDIDLAEIESKITPATRGLYVIHFHGFPAPIEELRALADRYGLMMIEDVALGFLSKLGKRPLGTWGDVSIFCLYKSMPIGAGGVLAVNHPAIGLPPEPTTCNRYSELNLTIKHVLNHIDLFGGPVGRYSRAAVQKTLQGLFALRRPRLESPDTMDFEPEMLDRALGPLARRLISRFDYKAAAQRRADNYRGLVDRLRGTDVHVLHEEIGEGVVPLFLPIVVRDKFPTTNALRKLKIDAVPVWGVHHPELTPGEFPGTEFLVNHLVEIPCHQDLTPQHLDRIARTLIELKPGVPDRLPQKASYAMA